MSRAIELPIILRDVAEPSNPPADSLSDELLREQRQLTAVEEFARAESSGEMPAQAKYYRSLLPAAPPGPGQQYAFDVDLDRCSGCKACVTACHTLNGLDEHETWRDVGLLVGGTTSLPVLQHVTTACHHCVEPGCLEACPVNAYEKDQLTGIVKHLDDQCFGCQYCTLACPYDVPKYHAKKGIVRKCDMCSSRLAAGEAPACVQACPHEAIRIQVVDVEQAVEAAEADNFLPAAPDPQITLPTTTYRTRRVFPRNTLPADYYSVNPQHPHWPLVLMLVLTQLSVGAFLVALALEYALSVDLRDTWRAMHAPFALGCGLLALAASTLHLGRPHLAYRAILGIRHSWLSREIVAFGLFAALATTYCAAVSFPIDAIQPFRGPLAWSVAVVGVVAVFCSVMIYVATWRECWNFPRTALRFGLSMGLLGATASSFTLLLLSSVASSARIQALAAEAVPLTLRLLAVLAAAKLLWEASAFFHLSSRRMTAMKRSALLMAHPLSHMALARFALGLLGGIVLPLLVIINGGHSGTVEWIVMLGMLAGACVLGEILERYLFFAAAAAPRMPGGIR